MKQSYIDIDNRLFSGGKIEGVEDARVLIENGEVIEKYGLESVATNIPKLLSGENTPEFSVFSQAYAGHQFGGFSILGDGRAHVIKEIEVGGKMFDVQLKGSGRTVYSRGGDGKANLSSMLREYIVSEAMHNLGVATNRAVGVYTTGEQVWRDGDTTGAVLARIASSHIRVGTFEYVAYLEDRKLLKKFTDYTIQRHFPEFSSSENKYLEVLEHVGSHQIDLVIDWMRVGFIHGVMNTDNTFISGDTLDYGPCAFMNNYHPDTVFSSIDSGGRYSFSNQKNIVVWNLTRLIETLLPLLDSDINIALEQGQKLIDSLTIQVQKKYSSMMLSKIGVNSETPESENLVTELLTLLQENRLDYTNSFVSLERYLEDNKYSDTNISTLKEWIISWKSSLENVDKSIALMQKTNPKIIPRNHLVEKALEQAREGNLEFMKDFLEVLANPYTGPADTKWTESDDDGGYRTFCGT